MRSNRPQCSRLSVLFFFNDTATTEIYTLSLHDALPISGPAHRPPQDRDRHRAADQLSRPPPQTRSCRRHGPEDRKSTRLNSSHDQISYAVFCLKKKTAPTAVVGSGSV